MDFYAVLDQVLALLRQRGRVSYRALKRQFDLDDAYLDDLKVEIIEVHQCAVEQEGTMLVWTGEAPSAAPSEPVQAPAPLAYTPSYLAEKILTSRSALEGERKQVTVLFADLKDSTELIRGLDPEAAQQLLDPALHHMMDAVHRFEGTVNQVLGDGIMALFGAPIAHEDHALRTALRPLGNSERILACLREAEALAAALDDSRRLGQVSRFLSNHFYLMGAYDQAIASGQRALALATADGDVVLHALANYYLGQVYLARGDYWRAIDCLGQTGAALEGAWRHERFGQVLLPAVSSRAYLAACYAELGMFAEGSVLGDEGFRIAEAVAHPASLMIASWGVGLLALRRGDLPRALPRLEQAVGLCQDADLPVRFPQTAAALGAAYILAGRVADAVLLLTQGMEQTTAMEMVVYQALCSLSLGEAQVLAGRLVEAHALAERALVLAREHQERGNQAYALRLLGDITARRGPPEVEQAEAHYQYALALAEELGMRPLQAHCHLSLGTLYAKTGQRQQARAELSTAIKLYRDMDMTFWLPQAEAAVAQAEGE